MDYSDLPIITISSEEEISEEKSSQVGSSISFLEYIQVQTEKLIHREALPFLYNSVYYCFQYPLFRVKDTNSIPNPYVQRRSDPYCTYRCRILLKLGSRSTQICVAFLYLNTFYLKFKYKPYRKINFKHI